MEKEKTNAIVTATKPELTFIENLMGQAIDQKSSVETLERILIMRKEFKKEFAEEQFDCAMSDFQSVCPVIEKKKQGAVTKAGKVAYFYAPLEAIVEQVKELVAEKGFSYRLETEDTEKGVKVTCIVKHKAGHSERSAVSVPLGGATSVMSAPQVKAAAVTYAKRYAFCNVFGIMTGDEDTDAKKDQGIDWVTALECTTSLVELQKVWSQVPTVIKKTLESLKEKMKKKYG